MIKFHYSYFVMALGFVLCGYYLNLIVFTTLIIFHEFGHYLVAKILEINVEGIIIYPYGGLTKLDDLINKDINNELLISISGIIFQLLFFLIIIILKEIGFIRDYVYDLYSIYNLELICFNLLPIYPLDGSKILGLILQRYFSFKSSNLFIVFISLIVIFSILLLDIYSGSYSYIMILSILFSYIYKFYKNLDYIYYRFLLERYLYKIEYKRKKIIYNSNKMIRNTTHIIKNGDKYLKESDFLKNLFDLNRKL